MSNVLTVAALLPVFLVLWYIYRQDHDPEPRGVVAATFGFGCLTVVPVLLMEWETFSDPFIQMYCQIAPAEEFWKLLVIMLYIWNHKAFDDSYDSIVYCVMASLGFAAVENMLYTIENGLAVAAMRSVTSIPGHAAFAVFMGYFVARAKHHSFYKRTANQVGAIAAAFLVPTFVHGTYDYLLTNPDWILLWVIFVLFMDVVAFLLVKKAAKDDKPMTSSEL